MEPLPQYSVLMSVYEKDRADWLFEAINSMACQSWPPAEILVVEDGALTEALTAVLDECARRWPDLMRRLPLKTRGGLAMAMARGVPECRFEWIARMDADDISAPERCEAELRLALQKKADIVGCDCVEFIGSIENAVARRVFPADHEEIVRFSRRKTPFCHPAVMMKKEMLLKAGNYRDVYLQEDYDLFVRMLQAGAVGCTLKACAYYVRVNEGFYNRRGGVRYVTALVKFNARLLKQGWIRPSDFFIRSAGNILLGLSPVLVRSWLYRRFLRK